MSDSTTIPLEISEGHYVETDDHVYKIIEIKEDGDTIVAKRLGSENRDYTVSEFARILSFTKSVDIRREWN